VRFHVHACNFEGNGDVMLNIALVLFMLSYIVVMVVYIR